ncbi:MAG: UvrD-helicase domain-containing protein [Deinococcales bacterium]
MLESNTVKVRIASAGTGKTTSLILRYLELLASGIPLRRIAGITFTRVAADEIKTRLKEMLEELKHTGHYLTKPVELPPKILEEALRERDGVVLSTIHGFMIEALRLCAPFLGLDPEFSLLGEWQAEAIFREEITSLKLSC